MSGEKKSVSFRFDLEILSLIDALKAKMHLTATAVIITALRELAKREGVQ